MTDTPARQPQEYQCSWCSRDKFTGDKSCPLDLKGSNGNSDIFNGVNRVIKSCGCGSYVDTRTTHTTHTSPPAPAGKSESVCEDCDIVHECYLCYNDVAPPCVLSAAKAARERVLEKMVNILAAHTINSDDFAKDGIKSGWILVGGYEPIIDEIDSLRAQQELI